MCGSQGAPLTPLHKTAWALKLDNHIYYVIHVTILFIISQVRHFQTLNTKITERCKNVKQMKTAQTIESTKWHDDIHLTNTYCEAFLKTAAQRF